MSLHCIIHDSFNDIKSNWRTFLPENHHLVSEDVLAIENSQLNDIKVQYVDLFKNNTWIGVAYIQCLNFNTKHYKNKTFDHPLFDPIKTCLIGRKVQFLICGNLFRVKFQGFYFKVYIYIRNLTFLDFFMFPPHKTHFENVFSSNISSVF